MVINSSDTFFSMIDDFDPNNKVLLENIGDILIQHPNFQLLRVLYLKSIKSQNSKDFDKALSHASISTYDRELLYKFLDTDIIQNKIDCIVTAPIDKNTIQNEHFYFNGHTEYFTNLSNENNSLMLMVKDKLKVGIVTNHISVNEVSKSLTTSQILKKIELMHQALVTDFNIQNPKIALLGLNPHSGDMGLIGREEIEIINPTIKKAIKNNFNIYGPFPADGFFASGNYQFFDGILGMYHDQGLIPFKILSQNEGVNFTAGLSFVRTSPDHGTAYDIVGKNKANNNSFINAVKTAKEIYLNRKMLN